VASTTAQCGRPPQRCEEAGQVDGERNGGRAAVARVDEEDSGARALTSEWQWPLRQKMVQ
jgi:hypothetical protein